MIVRMYTESDTEHLVSLFYDTVHSIAAHDYSPEQLNAWAPADEQMNKLISWPESLRLNRTYVAEINGTIVGFCDMTIQGYLDRLYVHKDFQRQGIASRLLRCVEKEAKKLGLTTITTHASITAKPFFESHGYESIEAQTVVRRGILLGNYQMQKSLTTS
ncbi:GNAT family N-acetyltransferase [Brevibacillus halotolerans]|nr:GNAT family N-acetyltransferase [Brevibacillus halotolerans]